MSLAETTGKEKLLKVHIIDPNTGDLDDTRGNFVIGLVGLRKEKDNATTFTMIQKGEMTGVDVLMTVRALKESIIPASAASSQKAINRTVIIILIIWINMECFFTDLT